MFRLCFKHLSFPPFSKCFQSFFAALAAGPEEGNGWMVIRLVSLQGQLVCPCSNSGSCEAALHLSLWIISCHLPTGEKTKTNCLSITRYLVGKTLCGVFLLQTKAGFYAKYLVNICGCAGD